MLENLKSTVCAANCALPASGLVKLTWGNVSAIDREKGLVVIKPSGVDYAYMDAEDMVVVDLSGTVVEGKKNPSSDTPTHLELYKAFSTIGSIIHTHAEWSTSWAQAGRSLPVFGTTHADYFYGEVPCTRDMSPEEIRTDYELHTGTLIVETFRERKLDPEKIPAVLVKSHGPFVWGTTPEDALHNAIVLDEIAKIALRTCALSDDPHAISSSLLDKHFLRKHGATAYYGQGCQ